MSESVDVAFHRLALNELLEARDWYDARSEDAGRRFRSAAVAAIDRIAEYPDSLPRAFKDYRYVRLPKFPYVIVFRERSGGLFVVAVAHTSRRFGYWRRRKE